MATLTLALSVPLSAALTMAAPATSPTPGATPAVTPAPAAAPAPAAGAAPATGPASPSPAPVTDPQTAAPTSAGAAPSVYNRPTPRATPHGPAVASPSHTHAHQHDDHRHPFTDIPRRRPTWGGFGHFSVGTVLGSWGDFASAIEHPQTGPTTGPSPAAITIGGGGGMLLAGRYILGGKGFGMWVPRMEADWGQAQLSGGGGGFDIGIVVLNARRWLLYPLVGAGGLGLDLKLSNTTNQPLTFGLGHTVDGGTIESFSTGFFTFNFGFGFRRLVYPRDFGGGLISGGELGVMMSLADGAWETPEGERVIGAPPLRMFGFYLRLDIGGGGFFWTTFEQKKWPPKRGRANTRRG